MRTRKFQVGMAGAILLGVFLASSYLAGLLGPAGDLLGPAQTLASSGPGEDELPCTVPEPEAGPARPWEATLPAGTYTQINGRNGNVFTAIPIVGWSGHGPSVGMGLYHNSANVESSFDLTRGMGFDLAPGFTTAYRSQLILNAPRDPDSKYGLADTGVIIAVADDGTQDRYIWNQDHWEPRPGSSTF